MSKDVKFYTPLEEKLNVYSHAFGLLLSFYGLIILLFKSIESGTLWHLISFSIYGLSLIILYSASTFYHNAKDPIRRSRLRIFDHASIYVLIAGTYTPFSLVTLHGKTGWLLFTTVWVFALVGIILKLFFTGRFNIISTLMYVFMGWLAIFVYQPLMENLPAEGLYFLISGGVFYTIGAILFSIKKIKFNHAIFHIFVLLGSICHFISVYYYI
jgi:hemolysin III